MSSSSLLDPSNLLILPATVAGALRYADWSAARQRGIGALARELVCAFLGTNTEPFFVPTGSRLDATGCEIGNPDGRYNQASVRQLLARYGIVSWGYGYWHGEMYFRVKKRQAHWAQYVLLRAGVPLLHGLLPGSRAGVRNGNGSQLKRPSARLPRPSHWRDFWEG